MVLADDQAMVRAGFRMILQSEPDIAVVAEAEDGEQAVAAVQRLRPDLVLMDIQMPGLDGLEATRRITARPELSTRVVILTTFERDEYVFDALRSGASGFLLKNAPPEELVHATRVVAQGNALLSASVTRRVIEQFAQRPARAVVGGELARLTEREREVLRLLASGKSNAEWQRSCSWERARSRPTCRTFWRSWACATACRQWSSPMRADSSRPARSVRNAPDGTGSLGQAVPARTPWSTSPSIV